MNYKEIIITGLANPATRKNIKEYLIRQYETAKKENYTINEFFDCCQEAVNYFESEIEKNYQYWIREDSEQLKGWVKRGDEQKIQMFQNRLDNLSIKTTKIRVESYIKNNSDGVKSLYGSDIPFIRKTINEVKISLEPKKNKKTDNIEPLNFELNQSEVIYLFDILQEAGFINPPKFHNGSYYRKLETYFSADKKPIKDAEQKRNKMKQDKPLSSAEDMRTKLIEAIQKMPY